MPIVRRLGPCLPLAAFAVLVLALLSLSRAGLAIAWSGRVAEEPAWPLLFLVGLRMDSVLLAMLLALPTLLLFGLPDRWWPRLRQPFLLYAVGGLLLLAFLEGATPRFLAEFERRPDRIFWEYLVHPREVLTTVFKEGLASLVVLTFLLPLLVWGAWRLMRRTWPAEPGLSWRTRLLLLPVAGILLALGIRGTLSHRPVNPATAAFSDQNLVNQLALNSTYSAAYALYALRHEGEPGSIYGRLDEAEVLAAVRSAAGLAGPPEDAARPTLRRVPAAAAAGRPRNLVIVLEESFGAEYVGRLGGPPITPCFDALSAEGRLFTRLYATGDRTVRGIEAVLSGFPPSPARSVVKLGLSQSRFFTAAVPLKNAGYETLFLYGGESHFDTMRSFLQGNGFARVIDQPLFKSPVFAGTWGVSDEDLFRRAVEELDALGDRPFLAFLLSTSNHVPFEFPDGRIQLHEQPQATRLNAIKYADFALGEFFRLAKEKAFYRDTVFLVVADHNVRTVGEGLLPVGSFRIPGLIIGPGFAPEVDDRVCSQIDLLPTILPRLGPALAHPMIGRDLLALPPDDPGRAVMQAGDLHGWRRGDRLVVHLPGGASRRFRVHPDDRLEPVEEPWPELTREALAHALFPGLVYRQRRYGGE